MQSKPLFNKRLYKAHAGITISKQASDVLNRSPRQPRSEADLHAIRSVVAGLKEIHKNLEFVKTALGHAVTYEKHDSDVRIEKKKNEIQMSCYYILSGSVESFYTVRNSMRRTQLPENEERSISYTNVAGDYTGLLSRDGPNFDLPPPECMNTIGNCEFLRIDRAVFHEKIQEAQKLFQDEIVRFLDGNYLFEKISEEDRLKLISQMVKQEFPSGKQILSQGQRQEHALFIAEGRCMYYRRIYLPKQNRSELFKMGVIEKGSYFDASCILDDQSSKFSVSAVGAVTCYLLNKWTIKNSESLLRALSTNRPLFPSDKEIESLVNESDQWQSYKRDTVRDAFILKHKSSSRIISKNDIPRTLDVAIRHGSLLRGSDSFTLSHQCRQQRKKEQMRSPTDDLDPFGRNSEQSSSPDDKMTERRNTKSVLKAVMLMKRSRNSIQKEKKNDESGFESNSSTDERIENKLKINSKRGVKSAPSIKCETLANRKLGRQTSTKHLKRNEEKRQNSSYYHADQRNKLSSSDGQIRKRNSKRPKKGANGALHSIDISSDLTDTPTRTSHGRNITTQLETPPPDRPNSSPNPYARDHEKRHTSEFDDRWVASDRKFRIKEIVNTRVPGKENPVETQYRRFEPSMFAYIDTMNSFGRERAVDPFGAQLRAKAWLRQAKERLATRGADYNPGQSPIIVIEEFCADEGGCDKQSSKESHDLRKQNAKVMESLLEDSDKENFAEELVTKVEWSTPVHETRYEAARCIEQAKTDIAILERQLVKLGWTRDMLNERERKRNERRKRNVRSSNERSIEETVKQDEPEVFMEKQPERKHKTLKRQDSIQKILEDHSSRRLHRRHRSNSDEKPDVHVNRHPILTTRYSTGSTGKPSSSRPRTLKARTFTIS